MLLSEGSWFPNVRRIDVVVGSAPPGKNASRHSLYWLGLLLSVGLGTEMDF